MMNPDASSNRPAGHDDAELPEIGPAYRRVVELRHDLRIARKRYLLTVLAGRDQIHLDLDGRLHRAWLDGESFQRGLDGRVRRVRIERPRPDDRWLEIEVIGQEAGTGVLERVGELVRAAANAAHAGTGLATELAAPLARAMDWDHARYTAELARFAAAYDPIPILPPDQNRALVLQATAGCSWNRCTFCHLYQDVRFRAHPIDEFRAHVRRVLALVGRALPLRRGVFIGQANALCIEQQQLRDAVRIMREELAAAARQIGEAETPTTDAAVDSWPLGSFIDSFTRRRTLAELRELRDLGLDSVALGLESGGERVLATLGKPAEVGEAIELVHELGEARIRRGIIVLVGAGGERLADEHLEHTVDAISAMRLGRRDRVYLSPLHVIAESEYARRCATEGLGILARPALVAQAESLRARLRAAGVSSAIALYDIRRFIY
jgi:hypothetical protein